MKDPVLIGGKSSSPGPKIVKRMVQEELIPDKLIITGNSYYEKYLLKGIKEKVDNLYFGDRNNNINMEKRNIKYKSRSEK